MQRRNDTLYMQISPPRSPGRPALCQESWTQAIRTGGKDLAG